VKKLPLDLEIGFNLLNLRCTRHNVPHANISGYRVIEMFDY
jgi:hypothetical protein